MFSSLISFLKKKKQTNNKESKERRKVSSAASIADERSTSRTSSEINLPLPSARLTTVKLLKGSSESKPANKGKIPEINAAEKSGTLIKKANKLYPNLDDSEVSKLREWRSVKPAAKKVVTIHDIGKEIACVVEPKLSDAKERIYRIKTLRNVSEKKLIAIMTMISNPPKFDYDFNCELKAKENSPDNVSDHECYQNIATFNQLKNYQRFIEKMKKKTKSKEVIGREPIQIPIFQSFSKTFRCYRGKANDVVHCP